MDQDFSGLIDHGDELARRRRAREMHPASRAERRRRAEGFSVEPCERERRHAAYAVEEVDRVCVHLQNLPLPPDPVADECLSAAVTRAAAAQARYEAALQRWGALQLSWPEQHDRLTGVLQRGPGVEHLLRQLQLCTRERRRFTLAVIEVVADSDGGLVTDDARRRLGVCLRAALRDYDVSVRLGTDEFVCGLIAMERATVQQRFSTLALALRLSPPCALRVRLLEVRDRESLLDALHGPDRTAAVPAYGAS